jgi:hypothetical protein
MAIMARGVVRGLEPLGEDATVMVLISRLLNRVSVMGHVAGVFTARAATPRLSLPLLRHPLEQLDQSGGRLRNATAPDFPAGHGVLRDAESLSQPSLRQAKSFSCSVEFGRRHVLDIAIGNIACQVLRENHVAIPTAERSGCQEKMLAPSARDTYHRLCERTPQEGLEDVEAALTAAR